jgi:phytoene synthase
MPSAVRPAFATLWNLDLALAEVVTTSTDPHLGAIRLAWWRDRLDDLDTQGPPPGEPRLNAINRHLMPVTNGATLSMIAIAWLPLLNPFPWCEDVAEGLRVRGELLFGVGSRILECKGSGAEAAGALWSLADGAFHCTDPESREFLLGEARAAIAQVPARMPREIRPLTVLAALAAHDVVREGRLSRVFAATAHRLRGTIPRG